MDKPGWYQRNFGWIPKPVRRVIVLVIGGTFFLLAIAGVVLPIMPGVVFIPLALAILAAEFAWAARWLHKIKTGAIDVQRRIRNGFSRQTHRHKVAVDNPGAADTQRVRANHLEN